MLPYRKGEPMPVSTRCFITLGLVGLLAAVLPAHSDFAWAAAPVPSSVPAKWELRFKVEQDLRLVVIDSQPYWYMTYLVTNRTGADQIFVPSAVLYTDAGDIISEGSDVPSSVIKQIQGLFGDPLLETSTQIIGTILQGRENARLGLLIWKAGSLEVNEVSVFFSGLSSETQLAVNPLTRQSSIVKKTLERRYKVSGNPLANHSAPAALASERWIMR